MEGFIMLAALAAWTVLLLGMATSHPNKEKR